MNNYKLTKLAVAEARLTGTGKQILNSGEIIIRPGIHDNHHHEEVALIISRKRANPILQWKSINEHLLYVRLKSSSQSYLL